MKILLNALMLLLLLVMPCFAAKGNCIARDISTRPDCPQAIQFLERLQEAVRSNQPAKVASMIHYPLRTAIADRRTLVRNRQQFLIKYGQIFTPPCGARFCPARVLTCGGIPTDS